MTAPNSAPNHSAALSAAAESVTAVQQAEVVNPHEVGWLFVQQYYTFLNKDPQKLHCFYNSKSKFIHGTEGESPETQEGQKAIHQRITELAFEDCKVLVSNVDSQPSHDGCIVIMVLGEMSNKGGASHKFAQSFVLAQQPSGYFVYNDMFRFLKEDIDNDYEDSADPVPDSTHAYGNEHAAYHEPAHVEEHHHRVPTPEPAHALRARSPAPATRARSPAPVTRARSPSPAKEVAAPAAKPAPAHVPHPEPAHGEKEPETEEQLYEESSTYATNASWESESADQQKTAAWAQSTAKPKAAAAPAPEPLHAASEQPKQRTISPSRQQQQQQQQQQQHHQQPADAASVSTTVSQHSDKPKSWASLAASTNKAWTAEQVSPAKGQ
ncbi:hypothetical protein HK101_003301, partial [Irineochytrium annulatum]